MKTIEVKNKKLILYCFSLWLLFIVTLPVFPLEADNASEYLLQMQIRSTPNPVGSGARALGMGGSFIAIADDATAASWNPAALIILKRPEISFVISNDQGKRAYDTSRVSGSIDDYSNDRSRLNYLSLAVPFSLFSRLMVFSINYQHLFEFSYEEQSRYTKYDPEGLDLEYNLRKKQHGFLAPLSPALAIQVVPSLSLGITVNIWSNKLFNNYWENISTIIQFSSHGGSRIKMPLSYGAGAALGFLDNYLLLSLDIYRTHWDDYHMPAPSIRDSRFNDELEYEANKKPTTQIRLGAEYLLFKKGHHIPLRSGIFYDPEPAEGGRDDFFGASIGTGIVYKDFALDIAYQYRFGKKSGTESMLGKRIIAKVKQHYLYSSVIIYF